MGVGGAGVNEPGLSRRSQDGTVKKLYLMSFSHLAAAFLCGLEAMPRLHCVCGWPPWPPRPDDHISLLPATTGDQEDDDDEGKAMLAQEEEVHVNDEEHDEQQHDQHGRGNVPIYLFTNKFLKRTASYSFFSTFSFRATFSPLS